MATLLADRAREGRPQTKVVFDCRGLLEMELLYEAGVDRLAELPGSLRQSIAEAGLREREAAHRADHVFCVSEAMRRRVCDEWGVDSVRTTTAWNHVEVTRIDASPARRMALREKLGLTDRFVVGYSGSIYRRQRFDQGLKVFRAIQAAEPRSFLLIFTANIERARSELAEAGISAEHFRVCEFDHQAALSKLCAMDIGLITTGLFEAPSVANEVCSPVKFAEYLAAGVPVLMSEGIGDYSRLARDARVGLVLPVYIGSGQLDLLVRQFILDWYREEDQLRRRCRETAIAKFDTEKHAAQLIQVHTGLVNEPPFVVSDQDSCPPQ